MIDCDILFIDWIINLTLNKSVDCLVNSIDWSISFYSEFLYYDWLIYFTVTSSAQPGSTSTVTEEHLRMSLLSAVEDKMKRRLREMFEQAQVSTCRHSQFKCRYFMHCQVILETLEIKDFVFFDCLIIIFLSFLISNYKKNFFKIKFWLIMINVPLQRIWYLPYWH